MAGLLVSEPAGRVVAVVVAVRGRSSIILFFCCLLFMMKYRNTVYRVKRGLFRSFNDSGCCARCIGVLVALWRSYRFSVSSNIKSFRSIDSVHCSKHIPVQHTNKDAAWVGFKKQYELVGHHDPTSVSTTRRSGMNQSTGHMSGWRR